MKLLKMRILNRIPERSLAVSEICHLRKKRVACWGLD